MFSGKPEERRIGVGWSSQFNCIGKSHPYIDICLKVNALT